jgi:hypothetical protein
MRLPGLSPELVRTIDPDGGFICMWTYWQPDPGAPDPEEHGQKLMMLTFLPCKPDEPCLCGSGKLYQDCCRPKSFMPIICPNPGVETSYGLVKPATAIFSEVAGDSLREKLDADPRLVNTEDTPRRGFWTYWGSPYLEAEYGILCFGDFELKNNRTLIVTALSEVRMQHLLGVVRDAIGDVNPRIRREPVPRYLKPGRGKKHRSKSHHE